MHFTDIAIRALKAPENGQRDYWDDSLRGFGVRVSQGGTKTFILLVNGNRRSLGRFPDLTLAAARKDAKKLLAETVLGEVRPAATTLQELIDLFFAVRCTPQNNKPSTIAEYRRIFKRHLTPLLSVKLADITHARINRVLDGLAPTPIEANHAFVAFRMLFRFAHQRRLVEHNPLDGMSLPYLPKSRDRVLTNDELRVIWHTAQEFPFPFGSIVALLILTGQRLSEVSGLRWDWIDDREMTITLPAAITKNSTQHTLPYGEMAKAVFDRTPRIAEFLFPSLDLTAAYVGHNKAKGRFAAACNTAWRAGGHDTEMAHWTLHDLRRTFSTMHARVGTPPHVTEALLNHKTGTRSPIQRIYDRHTYLPEMRSAIANYERHLSGLLGIGQNGSGVN